MMNFLKLCIVLHNEVLFDVVAYFFDAMAYVFMLWHRPTCSHHEVLFDEYFLCHGVLFILWRTYWCYGVLFDVMLYVMKLCCTFWCYDVVLMLWRIFCVWPTFDVTAYLLMLWRTFWCYVLRFDVMLYVLMLWRIFVCVMTYFWCYVVVPYC